MNFRIAFVVLVVLAVTSCAYFNTFYNAQKYYEDGVRPLQNGGSVNTALLDKSIEKSSKILQFHSKSEYVDDALMLIGKAYMYNREYTKAIRKFTELLEYFPNSKFSEDGLFYMGKTYLLQGESEIAKTIFLQVAARNKSRRIEAASECIGIMLEKKSFGEADSFINQLSEKDKKNNRIKFLSGKTKWSAGRHEDALDYLHKVNPGKLSKDESFDYYRILTDLYLKQNQMKKAEKSINEGIRIFQDHALRNSLYLMKARTLSATGEYEKALKLLNEVLIQTNPAAKDSLLFYRGGLYESYFADYEKALESYREIVNNEKNSKLYSESEMKVKSLELFISLTNDSLGENAEQNIENRFLLAEINYINLERIDDAISKYKSIADSFPKSVYAPKSMFALSYIYLREKNDSSLSCRYLKNIIKDYPNTEYSALADDRLKEMRFVCDTLR
ncbi:MAG: tetratricopeptide repeat protein [bacterium]|nr:tetratricopeptide repeat protein [bacterium]